MAAGYSRHDFIEARLRNLETYHLALSRLVGDEPATALIMETFEQVELRHTPIEATAAAGEQEEETAKVVAALARLSGENVKLEEIAGLQIVDEPPWPSASDRPSHAGQSGGNRRSEPSPWPSQGPSRGRADGSSAGRLRHSG